MNFPFKDFDPTGYLASVPQETILRHRELQERNFRMSATCSIPEEDSGEETIITPGASDNPSVGHGTIRERLVSTSLKRTPVDDEDLQDFHQHHLKENQSPFDLKYNLYSVVVS